MSRGIYMRTKMFSIQDFTEERMRNSFLPEAYMSDFLQTQSFEIVPVDGELPFEGDSYYAFLDRGASVLAVAHLDSVYAPTAPIVKDGKVYSSAVDNRLGAFIILQLLELKEIVTDVLFTTNEERCYSSARHFLPPQGKQYNWAFSFDRAGSDVALYQYGKPSPWVDALAQVGFTPAHGSYSDIADLSHLGCKCVNVGVGSCSNPHSVDAWADLDIAVNQLNRFVRFYDQNCQRLFPHDPNDVFLFETMMTDFDLWPDATPEEVERQKKWDDIHEKIVDCINDDRRK